MVRSVRSWCLSGLVVVAVLAGGLAARGADLSAADSEPRVLRMSRLVIGNYCGYGRRYGDLAAPAVDPVDLICKAHDACYISGRDRCDCNAELFDALGRVLTDEANSHVRRRGQLVSLIIHAMNPYCRIFPHGLVHAVRARLLAPNRQ